MQPECLFSASRQIKKIGVLGGIPLNNYKSKFKIMIKVNWTTVAKVLKFIATVITSVLGTIAVQSCSPYLF